MTANNQNLVKWIIAHGQSLKPLTYEILCNEGIETVDDLKQFKVDEFMEMCDSFRTQMPYGDKIRLKRLIEFMEVSDPSPSSKVMVSTALKKGVTWSQPIVSVESEASKIRKKILKEFDDTSAEIKKNKSKISTNIKEIFAKLQLAIKSREKDLLSNLDKITDLKERVVESQRKQFKISNMPNDEGKVDADVCFSFKQDDVMAYLNEIGDVSDSVAPEIIKLANPRGGKVIVTLDQMYSKVQVEWKRKDDDQEKENWTKKVVEMDKDSNELTVVTNSGGEYLFRVMVLDQYDKWSKYSKLKKMNIRSYYYYPQRWDNISKMEYSQINSFLCRGVYF